MSSLFKKAKNQQASLKIGIYGNAGTGKTYTASKIAIGIAEQVKKKPVYFIDTEVGSDYVLPLFEEAGVELYSAKTRAFSDLLVACKEAEANGSVMIVDSVTHFWTELMNAWRKKLNKKRIPLHYWADIKEQWAQFTDFYTNSGLHMIICGRARDIWEDERDSEDDTWQPHKTGEQEMKTEKEMAYEPSLLLHMNRVRTDDGKYLHRAFVVKDRTDQINGKEIDNPTFESFAPVWGKLNLRAKHVGVDTTRTSEKMIEKEDQTASKRARRRTIACEEIQGALVQGIPGQTAADKKAKMDILEKVFKTRSWEKISKDWDAISLEELEKSIPKVEKEIERYNKPLNKK